MLKRPAQLTVFGGTGATGHTAALIPDLPEHCKCGELQMVVKCSHLV